MIVAMIPMFTLVNLIVDNRISEPKGLEEAHNSLPEDKRKTIEVRDRRALPNGDET